MTDEAGKKDGEEWIEEFLNKLGIQDEELKEKIREKLREKILEKILEEKEKEEEKRDVEELREVLSTVTPFLENLFTWLRTGLKEVLGFIQASYDGKKLGEDIAQFYQALKSQGLPDDMIKEMVKEYYEKRLSSLPDWGSIVNKIMQGLSSFMEHSKVTSGERSKHESRKEDGMESESSGSSGVEKQ